MVTPTPKQAEIRDHDGLDLLVLAPAGCGKTEALALRIQGLLAREQVSHPRRVLVATFSNRARDNIRERLASYLTAAQLRDRVNITNFHGLSARIYRAHASTLGLDPEAILPENDWVGRQLERVQAPYPQRDAVQKALREAKQETATDEQVEEALRAARVPLALKLELQRRQENRLTYDDLPRLAEIILANDQVAQLYQQHFSAVVVDEFQDLTPQQLRLINRIGFGRTTYAGDLAQGIYGFTGARPAEVDAAIRAECSQQIVFTESHRSSPAVLSMVNALTPLTGGLTLSAAVPASWPSGGLAGRLGFAGVQDEVRVTVSFAKAILKRAPKQRIGIIARTKNRRRFVDEAMKTSGLEYYRWDDGVMDTDAARLMKQMLTRLDSRSFSSATDKPAYLRTLIGFDNIEDISTRESTADALEWALELLVGGESAAEVTGRIRVGDRNTLLTAPGVHLLSGHVGKGQQFDWVWIVGAEEGTLPFFKAESREEIAEEARVLSVMLSRARHGAIATWSANVPTLSGGTRGYAPSSFLPALDGITHDSVSAIDEWIGAADWRAIQSR